MSKNQYDRVEQKIPHSKSEKKNKDISIRGIPSSLRFLILVKNVGRN